MGETYNVRVLSKGVISKITIRELKSDSTGDYARLKYCNTGPEGSFTDGTFHMMAHDGNVWLTTIPSSPEYDESSTELLRFIVHRPANTCAEGWIMAKPADESQPAKMPGITAVYFGHGEHTAWWINE